MLSLLIGTVFVIGAASCNNNSAAESVAGGILGITTDKGVYQKSSKDGSEYQIKESDKEFYKFYLEEKEVN